MQALSHSQIAQRLDLLTEVSVALGNSPDTGTLLDRILKVAKAMTGADGGTLYRPCQDRTSLCFQISINDTLGIYQGGDSGNPIDIASVQLSDPDGKPNLSSGAAHYAKAGTSVNKQDVYQAKAYYF